MLHLKSRMIDRARIESALHILQSTSPSYLLMVSLDLAREELALRGAAAAARAIGLADTARERIDRIPGFGCLGREIVGRAGIADIDPTRLVISGARIGIDGFTLKKILFDKYRVDVELADWRNIVAIVTGGNDEEDMDRLVSGLRHIGEQMEESGGRRGPAVSSGSDRAPGAPLPFPPLPPRVLTPRRAFFAPKRQVPWTEAADKVAGEMIAPYPPGIPVIYPGEILTRETWEYLEQYRRDGRHIQGPADRELRTFMAISET